MSVAPVPTAACAADAGPPRTFIRPVARASALCTALASDAVTSFSARRTAAVSKACTRASQHATRRGQPGARALASPSLRKILDTQWTDHLD